MERDVLDTKRIPDIFLHVLFERHVGETRDENAGPVVRSTILVAAAWLKEEGCGDSVENWLPACGFLVAGFAPTEEGGIEGVIAEA